MPQGLAALSLSSRYRSGRNDLLHDFYLPCLEQATAYDRAVGFFTAGSIALAAQGFGSLTRRNGKVRLIAAPRLEAADLVALEQGYRLRLDETADKLLAEITPEKLSDLDEISKNRIALLTWLVASRHLDFKIASLIDIRAEGLYHEKLGLFRDARENEVAFAGSSNESISGIALNFESFNVFRSWIPQDRERLIEHRSDFDELWANQTPGLEIVNLPEAVQRRLIEIAPDSPPSEIIPLRQPPNISGAFKTAASEPYGFPVRPQSMSLHTHQREAIKAWIDADSQGILSMATGTGKTLAALSGMSAIAAALRQTKRSLFVLIVVPYKILVRQWQREVLVFGADPLLCYESASNWVDQLSERLRTLRRGHAGFALAITTTATFSGPWMQEVLRHAPKDFLIIADEVHNLGSEAALDALPISATMRLGLSATPQRHYDSEGSSRLEQYFGPSVYDFSLDQALAGGYLTKYRYQPVKVTLTEYEIQEYMLISRKIANLLRTSDPSLENLPEGPLRTLLFKRARLIGGARNKLSALRTAIEPYARSEKMLVYCSDASIGSSNRAPQRQLDAVVHLLGTELNMHVQSYTNQEDERARIDIERRFSDNTLQALIAIRCLDEGVDLPEVRRAFILASSTNPRQFIQRRGRVLRNAPGKDHAEIFDFTVVPPDDPDPAIFEAERRLFKRELERMTEFAEHAINGQQSMTGMLSLQKRYGLLGI
jgi:superfamily II DNA or RNA helicase